MLIGRKDFLIAWLLAVIVILSLMVIRGYREDEASKGTLSARQVKIYHVSPKNILRGHEEDLKIYGKGFTDEYEVWLERWFSKIRLERGKSYVDSNITDYINRFSLAPGTYNLVIKKDGKKVAKIRGAIKVNRPLWEIFFGE